MISRKWKLFFKVYWVRIAIVIAIFLLLTLAIWGLMSLESFYRNITLAQLPMQILLVAFNAAIFVYLYMAVLGGRGFTKLSKKMTVRGEFVNVKWSDVIGMDNVKEEAKEVVELIMDRVRVKRIGGKIVRGILMFGPPGCGKTYLAKAIATETGLPFVSMSGSEFVELFVGVGASRMRQLFKRARELAYGYGGCIIFIDELDAVGRNRVFSVYGGTEETNSTQNQLLAEMDGLQELEDKTGEGRPEQNIVVIGATNAPEERIDPALRRPGRFDRILYIDLPNLQDREKIYEYYLSKVKYDKSIDIGRLARKSVHKSPADIANVVKEAALIATRNKREELKFEDISEAIERIELGLKHKRILTPKEKEMVAYHESGHLIVTYLLHPTEDVFKASIVSRRHTLGVVWPQPREELYTQSKEKLLADIKVFLSGYTAEKLKFNTTADGVWGDFKEAMAIAHAMVWMLGMSEAGILGDYTAIPPSQLSETVKEKLNAETDKIFKVCLKEVEELLQKERPLLDRFAKELVEKEELEYDEIDSIFKEYGKTHAPAA